MDSITTTSASIAIPAPNNTLEIQMKKLLDNNIGDLTIISSDGKSINVYIDILISASDYFKLVKLDNKGDHIVDLTYDEVYILILFIYTRRMDGLSDLLIDQIFKVLDIARMWLLDEFVKKAANICKNRFENYCAHVYLLADKYRFDDIKALMLKSIKGDIGRFEFIGVDNFMERLSEDQAKEILSYIMKGGA